MELIFFHAIYFYLSKQSKQNPIFWVIVHYLLFKIFNFNFTHSKKKKKAQNKILIIY